MSKYIKLEDAIEAIEDKIADYIPTLYGRYREIPLELRVALERLPTIEPIEENGIFKGIKPPIEVSEDCISRAYAIEVLSHIKEDEQWRTECIDNEIRLIKLLPSVVPQVPSEDCISRKALLERKYKAKDIFDTEYEDWFVFVPTIEDAPSVVPKRSCYRCGLREDCEDSTERESKEGEWIKEYNGNGWNDYWDYTCPNCGKKYERADSVLYDSSYCPNCGAKMKG